MVRIRGERVLLREYSWEDLPRLRELVTDLDTVRWLGAGYLRPQTFEHTEAWLRAMLDGETGGVNYAVADPESDRFLGQVNLLRLDTQARQAELAAAFCPDCQGMGLGKEAIGLLLRCAFDTWNLNRVFLAVDADNARAIACYRACGFRVEGRLRQDRFHGGRYHDTLRMAVLRSEWDGAWWTA